MRDRDVPSWTSESSSARLQTIGSRTEQDRYRVSHYLDILNWMECTRVCRYIIRERIYHILLLLYFSLAEWTVAGLRYTLNIGSGTILPYA